ncbi:MAG: tyrosine-type recombinase/integrase [Bacteroidales bacterium]|jgi:site-specific recombinase XerD
MKKKVVLRRFFHRGKWRIGISFDFDAEINELVRSLTGRNFSNTHSCWYVDDTEDSLKEILRVCKGEADVDISAISTRNRSLPEESAEDIVPAEIISLTVVTPPPEDEPAFIPASGEIKKVVDRQRYGPVEFRINDTDGRLSIKFTGHYDKEWIDEIRSYGKYYYDKRRREFLLPWSKLTTDSLADYFATRGVEVKVIRQAVPEQVRADRKDIGNKVRSRELNEKAVEGLEFLRSYLEESRYSGRTVESYLSQLELFFKYFHDKDPLDITHSELSDFVNSYIIRLGFSSSYQNQMISAVKTFYEISGRGKIIPQILERPRRSRALPKVFSKDEVTRILSSVRNDKHKLLLWMIYSCGLRRSEVTNIKLTDLDRDRGILHIREGKGRIDRIVPVSDKVWIKLDEYVSAFRPVEYLFEGQGGGRYSVESVYNVFKNALNKAGINKDVGVHSLRHSYATHLHESGLDIRYIQELLGHRSSRTTEIYTHVSRRNLVAVRSPIEDLDIG